MDHEDKRSCVLRRKGEERLFARHMRKENPGAQVTLCFLVSRHSLEGPVFLDPRDVEQGQ